ncbi:hypothetical protein [Pseudomonas caricapapayae]|uniref:hypothetical protein n=1 Tax=Pseudomonas caricapapayae TaxID=46678 RepID=UPI000EFE3056|nr:hypothetical protein [Pseudomonas caricapapayae]
MNPLKALTKRSFWQIAGAALLIGFVGIAAHQLGINLISGTKHWDQARQQAYPYFLAWRILVYIGLGVSWAWMRKRVIARDPSADAAARLTRIQYAMIITILVFELMQLTRF